SVQPHARKASSSRRFPPRSNTRLDRGSPTRTRTSVPQWKCASPREYHGAKSMNVAVNLPEDIAQRLQATWRDLSLGTLEAIALEGYRSEALTRDQVARLLGLSFWEVEAFLKERRAYLAYNDEDLEQDRQTIDRLRPR